MRSGVREAQLSIALFAEDNSEVTSHESIGERDLCLELIHVMMVTI